MERSLSLLKWGKLLKRGIKTLNYRVDLGLLAHHFADIDFIRSVNAL